MDELFSFAPEAFLNLRGEEKTKQPQLILNYLLPSYKLIWRDSLIRGTQRLLSVKYLFGEAKIA